MHCGASAIALKCLSEEEVKWGGTSICFWNGSFYHHTCVTVPVRVVHREADKIGDQRLVAGGLQKHCSSSELSILSDSCLQVQF